MSCDHRRTERGSSRAERIVEMKRVVEMTPVVEMSRA